MNERIQELLIEAREQTKEGKFHAPTAVWAEKFAEMLVQECANVCYQHSWAAGGTDTAFGYGYKDCGDDIKRTFGVK